MQKFTRNDLKTGDIIVTRDKAVGLVITQKNAIIYPSGDYDVIDWNYNDDLTSMTKTSIWLLRRF